MNKLFIRFSGRPERTRKPKRGVHPHRTARCQASSGQTPVLQYHFNWKVISTAAGITWWKFYFRLYPTTIRSPQVIDFLGHLLRHLPGKLLVLWDALSAHRTRVVNDFIRAQRGRLALEWLPSYAPGAGPVRHYV